MKQTSPQRDGSDGTDTRPTRLPGAREVEIHPLDDQFDINEAFLSESDEADGAVAVDSGGPSERSTALPELNEVAAPQIHRSVASHIVAGPEFTASALSVAKLLESSVPVDWTEAVAIALRICREISRHPSAGAQEYVLDPQDIEITERGDLRVLPGAPGGDPFVKQVGRILRALLEGGDAPVQLRLIASQAAFDLPGFASLNELSAALRAFEQTPESDAIRMAFRRSREVRLPVQPEPPKWPAAEPGAPAVAMIGRAIPPAPAASLTPTRSHGHYRVPAVLSLVIAAALAYLVARGPSPSVQTGLLPSPDDGRGEPSKTETGGAVTHQEAAVAPQVEAHAPVAPQAPQRILPAPADRTAFSRSRATASVSSSALVVLPDVVPRTGLLGADRVEEDVQRAYDAIVLADPLYQLDPARSTPANRAALRDSKRLLVPDIARRDYQRAQDAFRAGEYDRAMGEGARVMKMLDDLDAIARPAGLREAVRDLLLRVEGEQVVEDQRVYTIADPGVIPPAALGRQLPVTPPIGVSHVQVGTLEMVINQEGRVEAVKLHTPLNRYHERMIVSAAKAWRYRPALKGLKPVRFRLISSINLPES